MADQTAANASGQMPVGYKPPARSGSTKPPPPPGSQRPKGGTGGKRYVRTQAGANRYGKPIGTEIIATPRDQRGAKAQGDKESTDRYKSLVSGDAGTQSAAMKGLNDDQLKRLSEVAFSFQSSDPNTARLRAGVSIEMQRRGLDVNRYGGLSGRGGSAQGNQRTASAPSGPGVEVINYTTGERYRVNTAAEKSAGAKSDAAARADERMALHEATMQEHKRLAAEAKTKRDKLAAEKKAAAEVARKQRLQQSLERTRNRNRARFGQKQSGLVQLSVSTEARQQAEAKGDALPGGRFPIRNIGDLHNAVAAFGRTKPQDREKVAKFICRRAKELGAEHVLGPAIREAAGYRQPVSLSAMVEPEVIELDGSWKHGWIPLDATALRAKNHGRSPGGAGSRGHHAAPGSGGGGGGKLTPKHEGNGTISDKTAERVDKAVHSHLGEEFSRVSGLRAKLDAAGMSRAAQDTHLKRMSKEGKIHLTPDSNRGSLTAADHANAVHIGGEANHLVRKARGKAGGEPLAIPAASKYRGTNFGAGATGKGTTAAARSGYPHRGTRFTKKKT